MIGARALALFDGGMSSQFGQLFRISTWGESHGGGVGVVIDGCPPLLRIREARYPARSRPAPARAERNRHAARGGGPVRDSLGRVRGKNDWYSHRNPRAQQGCAARGLQGNGDGIPPLARGFHLPGEIRHPQLAGRGTRFRPRNHRPCRGGGGGEKGACAILQLARNRRLREVDPRNRGASRSRYGTIRAGGEQYRSLSRPSGAGKR